MIRDQFLDRYIEAVQRDIEECRDALERVPKDEVEKYQGELRGLRKALSRLEAVLEENDR